MATITDSDVMRAVLRQLTGKVDYQVMADELGLPTKGAAQMRWARLKKKMEEGGAIGDPKTSKDSKAPQAPKPGKPKTAVEKGKSGPKGKKRKAATSDDSEDDEMKKLLKDAIEDEGEMSNKPMAKYSTMLPGTETGVDSRKEDKNSVEDTEDTEA
jgi:hypothetical protein